MSVDDRIRRGLVMIEHDLPDVDAPRAYDAVNTILAQQRRRRRTLLAVAAAIVLIVGAAATGLALSRRADGPPPVGPAKTAPSLAFMAADGRVAYLEPKGTIISTGRAANDFAVAPDGRLALVTGADADRMSVHLVDPAGGPDRILPYCRGCGVLNVGWSHDGTRVAYTVRTPGGRPFELWIDTLATGAVQRIQMPSFVVGARWSPDDTRLIVRVEQDSGTRLAVLDPAGGTASLTYLTPADRFDLFSRATWSADGDTVYFTAGSSRTGDPATDPDAFMDLFAVHPDGTGLRRITNVPVGTRLLWVETVGHRMLGAVAVGAGPQELAWVSPSDGSHTLIRDAGGRPVLGSLAQAVR